MLALEISEASWVIICTSALSALASIGAIITMIVKSHFDIVKAKLQREIDEATRLARDVELARFTAEQLGQVKAAGREREVRIINKIDENTAKTVEVKEHLNLLTDTEQLKSMTSLAKKLGSTEPVFYNVELPNEDYVPFELSEGSKVYWKSEQCDVGKQVRFLVEGPCKMGFHFHKSAEIISGIRGKLFYETSEESVVINPGQTYTTPPDTVHSARFEEPGEVLVHWPDQHTNVLEIGIWP